MAKFTSHDETNDVNDNGNHRIRGKALPRADTTMIPISRMKLLARFGLAATLALALWLSGCGGSSKAGTSAPAPTYYAIGGTVSGLAAGVTVVLRDNGTDTLTLGADGTFAFSAPVSRDGSYAVTVGTQPAGQICTVSNGAGTGVTGDVSNIKVLCSARTYTIGGTVSGLATGAQVALDNNGADPVIVSANGAFAFTTPVASSGSYAVSVGTQPAGQICTVTNGSGSGVTASVSNVAVQCSATTYTISGTVSGLASGSQVTLDNNGADPLTVLTNGVFTFTTPVASNGSYAVTVGTQPLGQTCTVASGSGRGVTANVSNVAVVCSAAAYTIGGTVSGLAPGAQVTLYDNGTDALAMTTNGAFTFATPVVFNAAYAVTVGTQPVGEICTVTSGSGIADADVSNVAIQCGSPQYVVSTFVASDPQFEEPLGIAVDASGNVYLADTADAQIKKITPDGVVTAFAGRGGPPTPGLPWADGIGLAAVFDGPVGLTVDTSGNVYVADVGNLDIRKITPAAVVTTFPGSFPEPFGVAVDATGNVYVADVSEPDIRRMTPAGAVTVVAGSGSQGAADGIGSAASFNEPTSIAVDASGNVYVADTGNNKIRKITPAGVVTTLAGSGSQGSADGIGSAASFNEPASIAVDASGNIYVADQGNNEIRRITPAGVVATVAGSGSQGSADGIGSAASFNGPQGVAVDAVGNLYVSDTGNKEIRKITLVP